MALENIEIQQKLQETFGSDVFDFKQEKDIFSLEMNADKNTAVILFLKNSPELRFHFLTDLCGIHYPDNEVNRQFEIVYHLHNWYENKRIKIKTFVSGTNPEIKTISTIFKSSNWMERETWDFYGINFVGHPQLNIKYGRNDFAPDAQRISYGRFWANRQRRPFFWTDNFK
jgi:NADH-quinone oxidoreductase subunit C